MFQAVAFATRRRADSCGQNIDMRAVEKFFLDAVVALALSELLVGQLAVEGDDTRKIFLELPGKDEASFSVILALQFFNRFGRTFDQISKADAEFDDAPVVRIVERFGNDAAVIEKRPKWIAAARVVVASTDRRLCWITTHNHELHSFA